MVEDIAYPGFIIFAVNCYFLACYFPFLDRMMYLLNVDFRYRISYYNNNLRRIISNTNLVDGLWPDYNDGSWPSCCYRSDFNEKEV